MLLIDVILFHVLSFACCSTSTQGEWYIYFIQCFYPFLHQESGTGFYACMKNCLLKTFLGFTTIFLLCVEINDNADHGELSTNQSLVILYSLLGAKIPFMGANKFAWSATMKPEMGLETQTKMNLLSQKIFAKNKSWITGEPNAMFVCYGGIPVSYFLLFLMLRS